MKYEVSLEQGSGTVSKIVYLGTDSVVLTSPTLPFQITVPVSQGAAIGLAVYGNSTGGIIHAQYEFTATGGNSSTKNEQDCGH